MFDRFDVNKICRAVFRCDFRFRVFTLIENFVGIGIGGTDLFVEKIINVVVRVIFFFDFFDLPIKLIICQIEFSLRSAK